MSGPACLVWGFGRVCKIGLAACCLLLAVLVPTALLRAQDWLPRQSVVNAASAKPTGLVLIPFALPGDGHDNATSVENVTKDELPQPINPASPTDQQFSPAGTAASSVDTPTVASPSTAPQAATEERSDSSKPVSTQQHEQAQTERALEPIPAPENAPTVEVAPASFKGVTPGRTTLVELQRLWGPPKELANRNGQLFYLYSVDPFPWVELLVSKGRVSSIVIRLEKPFPPEAVAEHLQLKPIRPVWIADEYGNILGQAYPERGVILGFRPTKKDEQFVPAVERIILEPIGPDPFLLRAETYAEAYPDLGLRDVEVALHFEPKSAKAHWLKGYLLLQLGNYEAALAACRQAVELVPSEPKYLLTLAQVLLKLERQEEALAVVKQLVQDSEQPAHVRAQVLVLLGDIVASGNSPDYKRALGIYVEAIRLADSVATSEHPAIRRPAKRALIEGHLGAAEAIAWGNWEAKEKSLPRWLARAELLLDNWAEQEKGAFQFRAKCITRALATCVGVQGTVDPASWKKRLDALVSEAEKAELSELCRRQLYHQFGLAYYNALQVYQMRHESEPALECGKKALSFLELPEKNDRDSDRDLYLLGRLYFRIGAIYSLDQQDHKAAIAWFDKALATFEKLEQPEPQHISRLGESLVSMAVSYWEAGHRQKAVELTERGLQLITQAVEAGRLPEKALEVPLHNLASMEKQFGNQQKAEQYLQQAARLQDTRQR